MSTKKNKKKRKAKGFSSVTSSRLSRQQKSKLESDLTNLIQNLIREGTTQNSIERKVSKLQSLVRGKQTRKNMDKIKMQILKKKEKKYKELIGPKFNKTLLELPLPILEKLINSIVAQLNIEDVEVSKHVINYILSIKTSDQIKYIIDRIINNQKKIHKLVKEYLKYLQNVLNYTTYPSSADEEQIERIQFDFAGDIDTAQRNMRDIQYQLNKLIRLRKTLMDKFLNLLILIDISPDDPQIEPFINYCNTNWEEFLSVESFSSMFKTREKIYEIESYFKKYINSLLDYLLDKLYQKLVITSNTSDLFTNINSIYIFFQGL